MKLPKLTGAAGLSLVSIGRVGLQFAIMPLLARALGPYPYGIMAIAMPVVGIACIVCDAGVSSLLLRSSDPEADDRGFTWAFLATGVATAAFLIIAEIIGRLAHPEARAVLFALGGMLPLTFLMAVPIARVTRQGRLGVIATGDALGVVTGACLAVYGAVKGWGVWSLVAQQLALLAVRTVVYSIASGYRPHLRRVRLRSDWIVNASFNLTGAGLFQSISRSVDNFLVAVLLGPRAAGAYAMSFQFVRLPETVMGGPIYMSLLYKFGLIELEDRAEAASLYLGSIGSLALLAIPSMAGLALVSPWFVDFLLGPQWTGAVPMLQALAGTGVVLTLTTVNAALLVSYQKYKWQFFLNAFASLSIVTAVVVGAKSNAVSVGILVTMATALQFLVSAVLIGAFLKINFAEFARPFLKPIIASAAMIVAVLGLSAYLPNTWLSFTTLAVLIAVGGGVYVIAVLILSRRDFIHDLRGIQKLFGA